MNTRRFILFLVAALLFVGLNFLPHPFDTWPGSVALGSAAYMWWKELA